MIRAAAFAAVLLVPALAAAQDVDGVIAAGPSASASAPMTTEQKIANILAGAKAADQTDLTVEPRKIHGEAGVSVGSDGYRSAYVQTVMPVGETGTVALSYSQSQGGRGYGYGYGPGARQGRFGGRQGESRNVGLAMEFDATKDRPTADGCPAAFLNGRQPVEPLWATEIRGYSACEPARAD